MKTFDCVGMKDRIQADILAQYEERKHEFASFAEFLHATESEWEREVRQGIAPDVGKK